VHSVIFNLISTAMLASDGTQEPMSNGLDGGGFWLPSQASTSAPSVDLTFNVITWISIFFFVLSIVLMLIFVIKWKRRDHTHMASSDVTHNTPLELTWAIIPLILVIAIFYVGLEGYLNLRTAPIGAYEVAVTAKRWSWDFKHPNGAVEGNILRVPVGRPVKLIMQSEDVLHALFIPAFRVKQDVVPGRILTMWFEATREGDYDLFCAQYCGKDHSQMHAVVRARNEQTFQAELQEAADWAKNTPKEQLYLEVPKRIYPRCQSCHTLDGKTSTGPTWRGVWHEIENGNVQFADGTNLKDLTGPGKMFASPEDYVRQSILNPQQKIVMNYTGAMPTFKGGLNDLEILGIIDFLKHLDEFDDKGNLKNPPATLAAATPAAPAK
jgi:cytochrome c oxidase subunit 2